ncbi:MAG: ABC transporter ATP-binding protein [Treponema sp.]
MSHNNKISSYFKTEITVLTIVTISGLLYNTGLLAAPYLQGKLIDAIAVGQLLRQVLFTAFLLVASTAIVQCSRAVKRFYVRRFANDVNAQMQNVIYANLVHQSEDTLLSDNVGNLMTRAVSDVDACVEGMRKFTTEIFDTGVFLISYLVVLLVYDWKLTLVSCAFIPLALFSAGRLRKIISGFTLSWRKSMSEVTNSTYDYVNNAMLYRINGRENDNCTAYEQLNKAYEKKAVLANIWENSMMPVYKVISLSGIILIVVFGGEKVINGGWSIGRFTAYITMFAALAEKASHAGKLFNSVQKAEVSWERIKPFMNDSFPDSNKISDTPKTFFDTDSACPAVSFTNVSFAWPKSGSIIHNVSFSLGQGKILGMTGPVACGKSTLARLFLGGRRYSGSIKIFGKELSELADCSRIKLIAYMGHEASLLSASIYDNVTLGNDGNIDDVLQTVCFDTDLREMTDGIKTLVGNGGVRLSGGQQERIALARTLYHKTPFIILDDPFASVDRTTEQIILSNIRRKYSDCTVLLISHRLSQFKTLDEVLLLENDGTAICSTHEKLMKYSKTYRSLYELQEKHIDEEART